MARLGLVVKMRGIVALFVALLWLTSAEAHGYVVDITDPAYAGGADPTGVRDSGPAINLATAAARALSNPLGTITAELKCPPGLYMTNEALNFTHFSDAVALGGSNQGLNFTVSCYGAQIVSGPSFPANQSIIDAIGSRFIRLRGVTVSGSQNAPPLNGIQIGRDGYLNGEPASGGDSMVFNDVVISGWFSRCAYYNFGGEQTVNFNPNYENLQTGGHDICLDGENHWGVTSPYVTETIPQNSPVSFNSNSFYGGKVTGIVSPIWLDNVSRPEFHDFYAEGTTGPCVTLFANPATNTQVVRPLFDLHCETTAMAYTFEFDGAATQTLSGFQYEDLSNEAATAVLHLGPGVTHLVLPDADIHIDAFTQTPMMFDTPTSYVASGVAFVNCAACWQQPAGWSGVLRTYSGAEGRGALALMSPTGAPKWTFSDGLNDALVGTNLTTGGNWLVDGGVLSLGEGGLMALVPNAATILKGYTVATLPGGIPGYRTHVTDAITCAFGIMPVGGGSVVCPVFFNGTGWVGD